jgi:hypothetical protein
MYDVCHTLALPVSLSSADEILVSFKLTAAAAVSLSYPMPISFLYTFTITQPQLQPLLHLS